ncbi:WD40 repeat domain-containing protein [Synechococcus sp. PCC 7336]|uniref:WD40 repeat domain-containing protein n=1 Tax=Synechococcus sp. PCC 7336 TaxID=195250 RepID=UPI00034CBFBF|nr:hypothetical protein [Synechococcus sp. PCC 7336]
MTQYILMTMKFKCQNAFNLLSKFFITLFLFLFVDVYLLPKGLANSFCEDGEESIESLVQETEKLLDINQQFQALFTITKAGSRVIDTYVGCRDLLDRLYKLTVLSASDLREYNRLRVNDPLFLELSPDGNLLASYGFHRIQLWNLDGSIAAAWDRQELPGVITDLSFSPDSGLIVVGGRSQVSLIDINNLMIKSFESSADIVDRVLFSSDGRSIVGLNNKTIRSGLQGGYVERWLVENGHLLDRFVAGSEYEVLNVYLSSSIFYVAVLRYYQDRLSIELINLNNNQITELKDLENFQDFGVHRFEFSPDLNYIVLTSESGFIELRTILGDLIGLLDGFIRQGRYLERHQLLHLEFSPDSQLLATLNFDRQLKVWNVDSTARADIQLIDRQIAEETWTHGSIGAMEFSPDSQLIVYGDPNGLIRIWTISGSPLLQLDGHQSNVLDLQFSPDGQTLFSIDSNGNVIFWNPYSPLLETASDIIDVPVISYEELLGLSCNWLQDYLASNPDLSEEDRRMCDWQNP